VVSKKPLFTGKARPSVVQSQINVYEAALNRVRFIYQEFEGNVVVSNSGGKDSTVVVELAARVSAELGYGPAKVQWLDQECEFQATVDYQRYLAYEREDIHFDWYQVPFRIFNATNHDYPWLNVWGPGEEWMRDKEPTSIHENTFGTDRFAEVLEGMNTRGFYNDRPLAVLTGMRTEESPSRRVLMLSRPSYKWLTYSSGSWYSIMFNPIFDWTFRDVWKAIFDNGWAYNEHYNTLFRYGVPPKKMRVSNFTHESALASLHYLQEVEPETWERATRRLQGVSAFGHVGHAVVERLPYMFESWTEYVEYLIDNLCTEQYQKDMFYKLWRSIWVGLPRLPKEQAAQLMVGAVINNDLYGSNIKQVLVKQRQIYGKNGSYVPAEEKK
jgi:predicted phosphoadenosine phosphosulfate sulfurtransferase